MEGHHVLSCVVFWCHLRWLNFTALIKQSRVQSYFIGHWVGSAITWPINRQTQYLFLRYPIQFDL